MGKNREMRKISLLLGSCLLLLAFWVAPAQADSYAEMSGNYRRESPMSFGLDIGYGAIHFPDFEFAPGVTNSSANHAIHLDFEWLPIQSLGKFGIGIGTAAILGTSAQISTGTYRVTLVPIKSFVSYRLDFVDRQIVVPFAKVGAGVTWAYQDQRATQMFRSVEFSGGLEINLSAIDTEAAKVLDREIGINSTYLTLQYGRSQSVGSQNQIDLSHEEYMAGLRFEM